MSLLAMTLLAGAAASGAAAAAKPNILFVVSDDLGWNDKVGAGIRSLGRIHL